MIKNRSKSVKISRSRLSDEYLTYFTFSKKNTHTIAYGLGKAFAVFSFSIFHTVKPNDLQDPFFCLYFCHLLTKLKNKRRNNRQTSRAVQNCSYNSWVGTTTPTKTSEGFSGFRETRDGIRYFFKRKSYVAAVEDGRFNDVNIFSKKPPHPRQSVPVFGGGGILEKVTFMDYT